MRPSVRCGRLTLAFMLQSSSYGRSCATIRRSTQINSATVSQPQVSHVPPFLASLRPSASTKETLPCDHQTIVAVEIQPRHRQFDDLPRMQPGILLEVGNNRHGSPRVGETSTAAASSMLPPDVTRHFSYWLFLWHDGGDGPPRRRFTSLRAPLKIQEHATLLDSETVSLLWLASKELCESSEMFGPPQAASWTLVRTELRIGRQKEEAMRDLERTASNTANKMARR
jgi:hypothetical protein